MYNLTDKDVEMLEAFFENRINEKDKIILQNRFVAEPDFKLEFEQHLTMLRILQKKRMLDTRNFLENIDTQNLDNKLSFWSKYSLLIIASIIISIVVLSYYFYKSSNAPQPEKSIMPITIADTIQNVDTKAKEIKHDTISKIRANVLKKKTGNTQKHKLIASIDVERMSQIIDLHYVRPTFATARSMHAETLRDSLVYWYNDSAFDSVINYVKEKKISNPEIEFLIGMCFYETGKYHQVVNILSNVHTSGLLQEEVEWYLMLTSIKIGVAAIDYEKMAAKILSNKNHLYYKDTQKLQMDLQAL